MRYIDATLYAITSFEQRRLIKQQVKAGLLVAPMTGDKDKDSGQSDKGKKSGKLWDSSDEETSSEEDFNWLEEKIKNKKDLNEEEKRLLKGILQPPFKDRKDPDYFKRLK